MEGAHGGSGKPKLMGYKWTPEAVANHEKNMAEYRALGKITTHTIEKKPLSDAQAHKRGGRKPGKYGNVKTEAEGMKFDSKREAKRWMNLRLEETAGQIKDLTRQVVYPLVVNGMQICIYVADFVYERNGLVVEDAKGFKTPEYRLKAKLMLACHGITVLET